MSNKNFRYQHIYSAVENKAPSADTLYVGEIAVNGNAEKPQLFIKDSSGNVRSFYSDYVVNLSQAEYDALVSAGTVDERILYNITDADPIDVSGYVSSGSVDTTASTSAYTLSFSGDNGSLFSLEVPKGGDGKKMIAGDNISIVSGETADTISVSGASAITSSSTEVVQSKAIYEELDKKLDKVNFINNLYPKGSVYITYEYKNPSTFIGGEWELIGGEDADKNYYPAFAIDTDTAGTTINESLPNIKGNVALQSAFNSTFAPSGAFSQDGTLYEETIDGSGPRKRGNVYFNAHNSNSTYQDGAHVNVNAIKLFHWRRTDDGTIVEQITPLDVDVKDVLFTGSVGGGAAEVTLSNNFEEYKTLKITFLAATSWIMVRYIDIKDIKPRYLFDLNWANDAYRYCYFQGSQPSSGNKLLIDATSDVYITKVEGLKPVPTTNITAGEGIVIEGSEISVAPLQKVTCTKTSLIGNEFYFGGEYYPALKTVHIHGGFAPTTAIGNGSGICRLTIGDKQVVFDDNVIGYVMCNNNATYMKFCQSAKDTNQITARDLTIDTGRFYWCDLWCPAHLE